MLKSGSTTGDIVRVQRNSSSVEITNIGVLGADPATEIELARAETTVALYRAVTSAIQSGQVSLQCAVDMSDLAISAVMAGVPVELCPACRRVPVAHGVLAPLGPGGARVQVCVACSAVSRSVDYVLREEDN